jgi:superfamily II DNA or RNA helicase
MTIELRDYQMHAVEATRMCIRRGVRRVLVNAATGAGKTVIAAAIVRGAMEKGKRVLFLAHRRELIMQCCAKLVEAGIADFGVIMAGERLAQAAAPVQVASIQTLLRRDLPLADLLIIDEAHRASAGSYRTVLANYPDAVVLGLSATPERLDGRGLDDLFDELIVVESVPGLIERGYLLAPVCYVGPTGDLSGVRTRRGDYDEAQLAAAMDRPRLVGDIIGNWMRLAHGRPTVVFATSVAHAEHITLEFFAAGVPAACVSGETPLAQREAIIADWRAGVIQVVTNVLVFTEGFDMPELECCILARPTQSVTLYLQMVGRVMRPAPNKVRALVLDHAGCCVRHGGPHLHREWSLEGMAKRRRERTEVQPVCGVCGLVYEAAPALELSGQQPDLRAAFADQATKLLHEGPKARGLAVCPGCGAADCRVCATPFQLGKGQEWAQCPACLARYEGLGAADPAGRDPAIPDAAPAMLVELGDEVPQRVLVLNEYKRLMNEAREKGRKRGWAYWRLRERWDEATLRQCLPRHKADWWRGTAA